MHWSRRCCTAYKVMLGSRSGKARRALPVRRQQRRAAPGQRREGRRQRTRRRRPPSRCRRRRRSKSRPKDVCPRATPAIAVASGWMPRMIAPWLAGTKRSAQANKSGNPTTTPAATKAKLRTCRRDGRGCRVITSNSAANVAATSAPQANKRGLQLSRCHARSRKSQAEATDTEEAVQESRRAGGCSEPMTSHGYAFYEGVRCLTIAYTIGYAPAAGK